jgi:hypothetical protein
MHDLANYSIETDQSVWLSFKDGHTLRVGVGQLPRYLTPHDLQKVRRTMKLRRDFIKHHMPKTMAIALVLGLTALAVTSGQILASLWNEQHSSPIDIPKPEIVRHLLPGDDPHPTPEIQSAPAVLADSDKPDKKQDANRAAAKTKPVPTIKPAASRGTTRPSVIVTPIAPPDTGHGIEPTPLPEVTPEPTPVPTPTPEPRANDTNGQVGGACTGPTDPGCGSYTP